MAGGALIEKRYQAMMGSESPQAQPSPRQRQERHGSQGTPRGSSIIDRHMEGMKAAKLSAPTDKSARAGKGNTGDGGSILEREYQSLMGGATNTRPRQQRRRSVDEREQLAVKKNQAKKERMEAERALMSGMQASKDKMRAIEKKSSPEAVRRPISPESGLSPLAKKAAAQGSAGLAVHAGGADYLKKVKATKRVPNVVPEPTSKALEKRMDEMLGK